MIENSDVLFNLVYLDEATGLYNTRYLNHFLERKMIQAETSCQAFSVLFIDIDRFKEINDCYGHMMGTQVLKELSNQLKNTVREEDAVFRYGGDEFVVVSSECDLKSARKVAEKTAERIRCAVEKTPFMKSDHLEIYLTVSIGIAIYPIHGTSKKELMEAADRAMYWVKKTVKNQIAFAEDSSLGNRTLRGQVGGS